MIELYKKKNSIFSVNKEVIKQVHMAPEIKEINEGINKFID